MNKIYLDYAAATPIADKVSRVTGKHNKIFYNPSAIYRQGRAAADIIEDSRKKSANLLGVKPAEIIFTSGSTESNNLAIGGLMNRYPKGRVAIAATEHKAVLEAARGFASGVDIIKVDGNGLITAESLQAAIKPNTVLVSIAMADSELGAVQNFRKLSQVINQCRQRRGKDQLPLYWHTDASQAANYLDLHVERLGVDLLSLGGNKIYGPKSIGLLYVKHKIELKPVTFGGGQERGLRSGTENTSAIAGLAAAIELAQAERHKETARLGNLKNRFINNLSSIDGLELNGDSRWQLPNFINLSLPGMDGERLVMALDEAGLMVGTGAACTINYDQPSHVLKAIGLSDQQANGSLRLTMGRPTTAAEVDKSAKLIIMAASP